VPVVTAIVAQMAGVAQCCDVIREGILVEVRGMQLKPLISNMPILDQLIKPLWVNFPNSRYEIRLGF
jgi:hypothetical protein